MESMNYEEKGCWYVLSTPLWGTGIYTLVDPEGRPSIRDGNLAVLNDSADALNQKYKLGEHSVSRYTCTFCGTTDPEAHRCPDCMERPCRCECGDGHLKCIGDITAEDLKKADKSMERLFNLFIQSNDQFYGPEEGTVEDWEIANNHVKVLRRLAGLI